MKLEGLQRAIGYRFTRPELLSQALTHRSFGSPHNERLEFLGDSVLNCVTAIALFDRFNDLREGDLSRLRANLVRQEALHRVADSLHLGDYLNLGEGELKSGGHRRPSILADALEAIFAAVYLDAGFEAARSVIDRLYAPALAELDPARALKDPKTALQEWLQGRRMPLPRYSLAATRGEAHQQEFEVECEIAGLGLKTRGNGVSRRAAEQQSAQRALELLPKQ
ncbi:MULTISPECIES: ribonuclease III [Zoogloea]|jgi:ribonuclease-3|uniref:Ribonuclease 3 n=1 Tax=Zoogloea dura TaxID=2728840 RepID=A0A848G134_9RHOO|nr:ribonuclease III [Zoogloea dura]KAB2967911.1 MAG: ribonuclease III [Zoogloea sp.]NML24780.1 ribonuclease III [Zoogloea dura]